MRISLLRKPVPHRLAVRGTSCRVDLKGERYSALLRFEPHNGGLLAHSALVVTAGRPTGNLAARYPSAVDGGVNLIMAALVSSVSYTHLTLPTKA